MRFALLATLGILLAGPGSAQSPAAAPDIEMWRLDCGTIELSDTAPFSDAHLYDGEPRTLTVSCYLIRNGDRYLLWDAGLSRELVGTRFTQGVFTVSVERSIIDQLGDIGIEPRAVTFAGVSHYHFDHISQLADFSSSQLIIGAKDWSVVKATTTPNELVDPRPFAPWLAENGPEVVAPIHDHDVFGDGSVLVKSMPGHTPGHASLLVRLPATGDVLLTGDLYHFEEQVTNRGVPEFNVSRADTLASFERFNAIATALNATVVIQHDPRHVDRLPAFPKSAR